jgi:hypothetical protein
MFVRPRHAHAVVSAVLLLSCAAGTQQSGSGQVAPPAELTPDSGVSEPGVYTSRFFGMTYRYPIDWKIQPLLKQKAGSPKVCILLFVTLPAKQVEFTALSVTAREVSAPSETPQEYFNTENSSRDFRPVHPPQKVSLGNKDFLRFDGEQGAKTSKIRIAELVSIQKGYVLEFLFVDGAAKNRVGEFDRTLDTIRFSSP